ncbi:MAG: twitching motility protein PilT [Nitrospirae bacterium GWA2_42_11]|nr:MAG: twitching motility protein PilT [Nitrospirae bacterium GWA2_42_11]OGW65220.1 MAG: twitching motility protein PilT [Nitrospirae bacterium RIFCSPHIGHO2_02_FULL_40_19]HKZ56438.1 type II toxin-antitoxin system VapC family toxin [Thermodesulfovibrionales bacterium]
MEKRKIILDTSAYSAFLRGNALIKSEIQQADQIALNPIILGELLAGFSMGTKEINNRATLQEFLSSPRVNIMEIDEGTSERYAAIVKTLYENGTPIPTNDIWIAASAMQHGLRVLTTDEHYLNVSQIITDYFEVQ